MTTTSTKTDALSQLLASKEIIILDGAMGTELQNMGHDVSGQLWSASILIQDPQGIYDIHRQYFEQGADIIITASYQAAVKGLLEHGQIQDEAHALEIIRTSCQLALKARDDYWKTAPENTLAGRPRGLVAGSVGPYGAYLGTGAEYTGDYDPNLTIDDLKQFHRGRLMALLDTEIDVIAFETIPSYKELEAIVELFNELCSKRTHKRKVTAWVSLSVKNEQELGEGSPIQAACNLIDQNKENFKAIGVNCNPLRITNEVLATLHKFTDLPLIAYPNSGENYDPVTKGWHGSEDKKTLEGESPEWIKNGARIIGGCCRTTPKDINRLYKAHNKCC